GLTKSWGRFLRDWDRSLRAGNYPETTRYNYLLAAAQLVRYLNQHATPGLEAEDAAEDPTEVTRAHIEAFQGWMNETRSASTALNKHKGLQQFFTWLMLDEEEIDRSPMERVRQPRTVKKLIPVIRDDDTRKVLAACKGKTFRQPHPGGYRPGHRLGALPRQGQPRPPRAVRPEDRLGGEPVSAGPRQAQGRRAAGPVAGRAGREAPGAERHRDHAQAAGPVRRGEGRACPPVAARLRTRVETGRRGLGWPDAADELDLRGHAPPLRRQPPSAPRRPISGWGSARMPPPPGGRSRC
ncbi:phage integrase N-terminal SAM-like domain-containing protein, partial [Streptomyces albiflaviniger]|nr:phage integrase N-terminal SAM-like domain-containing protein [Streptomyces albiflaviniger]